MRALVAALGFLTLVGCGASSDEKQAAQALAPQPQTAEQKAQVEKIKAQFPQPSAPGHS